MRSTIAIASTFAALAYADSAWRAPMSVGAGEGSWGAGSYSGSGSKWNGTEEPSESSSIGTAPHSVHPSSTLPAPVPTMHNHTSSVTPPRPIITSSRKHNSTLPGPTWHAASEPCDEEEYSYSKHAPSTHPGPVRVSSTPVAPYYVSSRPAHINGTAPAPVFTSKPGNYSGGPGHYKPHAGEEPCEETETETKYVSGYSTPAAPVIPASAPPYPYMISYPVAVPAKSATPVAPVAPGASKPVVPQIISVPAAPGVPAASEPAAAAYNAPEASKPVGPVYNAPEASKAAAAAAYDAAPEAASKPVGPVYNAPSASKPAESATTAVAPVYGVPTASAKASATGSWASGYGSKTEGPLMATGAAALHGVNAVVAGVVGLAAVVLA